MEWTDQQKHALDSALYWLEAADFTGDKVFKIFGYAGTGKTTLVQEFAARVEGQVLFGAFTGKAALVLQRKGCTNARTIHSLIYRPKEKSRLHLLELQEELAALHGAEPDRERELRALARAEEENLRRPAFSLNLDSEVRGAACLVIDEVSMVGKEMAKDLLDFGTPILVLGDPAQLPPVADSGYFIEGEPDAMLTEIQRQAADSPVVALATSVRAGNPLRYASWQSMGHETSLVLPFGKLSIDDLAGFDQVLCGRNKTRKEINKRFRAFHGRTSHLPEPGDRLVCLRNNGQNGLLNGGTWKVTGSHVVSDDRLWLDLVDEELGLPLGTEAHRHHFEDRVDQIPYWDRREADEFDYGYALTVHKAQGSSWARVCLIDESSCFGADSWRWLYTGITRAEVQVTVVH